MVPYDRRSGTQSYSGVDPLLVFAKLEFRKKFLHFFIWEKILTRKREHLINLNLHKLANTLNLICLQSWLDRVGATVSDGPNVSPERRSSEVVSLRHDLGDQSVVDISVAGAESAPDGAIAVADLVERPYDVELSLFEQGQELSVDNFHLGGAQESEKLVGIFSDSREARNLEQLEHEGFVFFVRTLF